MDDNRGPRLLASCWSLVGASAIFLSLRVYCKLWRGRGLWWDDHLMVVAWVALAIAVSINSYIVSLGFGRHLDTISTDNQKTINLCTILVATFGILSTTISKTSFALTLYRIVISQWVKYLLIFVIVTINLSMNLVWIFGFAKCTPLQRLWDSSVPGTCWSKTNLVRYQLFAAYYSALLDFVLAFIPWKILMGMVMLRREKFGVAVAMSLGSVAGICGIVKAVLVVSIISPDITYDRVDLTIWTLTEPAVTIMAACIPVLRMLYLELKSSQRSYFRSRPWMDPYSLEQTHPDHKSRRETRYGHNQRYARTSVVIMSTSGWQDSQEALQDLGANQTGVTLPVGGIMKTEEVNVQHSRLSRISGDDSFELKSVQIAHKREDGKM
ncbi:hypothetical protein SUNI508_06913 [Seiridium unicorne]|uniref:Rhodopsin domain-containing protein n=1 Tax=Seiridium unicorne TaxID=138068 RepID=A0ABR2UZB6_9PEZI